MDINKACEFIRECGAFMVLTVKDGRPCGRPFGAIMLYDGRLYIATTPKKPVWHQLVENGVVQLLAQKTGTRDWIRIDGNAASCEDMAIKRRMMTECPILSNHYSSAEDENYAVIEITVLDIEAFVK